MREPPKGFSGVFLWTLGSARLAAGARIPSGRAAEAVAAITASDGTGRTPLAGIVVLGRWLGAKPGDSAWGVTQVESGDTGFTVRLDSGIVVDVRQPGDAQLAPGPYGDLFVIGTARDVLVTEDGRPAEWLPSVRGGRAHDMRGRPQRWPRRRPPELRSPFARKEPLPALMLSVWHARPLPADLAP